MGIRRYTEEQIVTILKESAAGAKTEELCRKYGDYAEQTQERYKAPANIMSR